MRYMYFRILAVQIQIVYNDDNNVRLLFYYRVYYILDICFIDDEYRDCWRKEEGGRRNGGA